jgi:hypothetical protein
MSTLSAAIATKSERFSVAILSKPARSPSGREYRGLFDDPSDLETMDAIVIATPADTQLDFLSAGVFLEAAQAQGKDYLR